MEEWLKEIQQVIDNECQLDKARRKRGISKTQFAHELAEHLNKMWSPKYKNGKMLKVKVK